MEQLIEAFGLDIRLIIIQIFNFGLLMAALSYFLYKPVLAMLKEREEKIAAGIEDAEVAKQAKEQAAEEKKEILATANKEAEAMAVRAKEHAGEKADQIVATANKKAEQVLVDAKKHSEELKSAALKESEAEIAKLAVLAAEKVLKERTS